MPKAKSPKLRISQRLMMLMFNEEQVAQIMEMLQRNRGAVDEVWLFTENDGQDFRFIPMPEVERRAKIIAGHIEMLKKLGIGASINVLNTIGHSDYAEPFLDPLPYPGIIGPEGNMSLCCLCPRQPGMRDYVAAKYTAYAKARPETIWIDDDTRLFHHPPRASHGCYCDTCIAEFSRRTGKAWSRESVHQAITRNDYPAMNQDRDAWMHYLSDQIVEIHHVIRDAVRAVDPSIILGGMNTQFSWFTAYCSRFAERFEAMRYSPDEVIRARPGGGTFTDDRPAELYGKAWAVAFQNAQFPPNTERAVEVENYPFQFFGKSAASTAREGSLYLSIGSEGVAFDMNGNLGNNPLEYLRYFDLLHQRRPYFEAIYSSAHNSSALGLNIAFNPEHAAWTPSDGATFSSTDAHHFAGACEWGFLGIPLRFAGENEGPSLLQGDMAKGFSPERLAAILKRNVVMDVDALCHLWKVGLGPQVGVKVVKWFNTGVFERFASHPLNSGFENYTREIQQGYYGGTAGIVEPEGSAVQPISKLYNYRKEELGTCSVAIETASGNRIVVLGYRPWDYLGLPGKSAQCRNIVDWLHGSSVTPRFAGNDKAVLHAWRTASGRIGASLYNASEDGIPEPRLVGMPLSQKLEIISPEMTKTSVTVSAAGEALLPPLSPWGEYLIGT